MEKIDSIIAQQSQTITHLNAVAGHLPPETNETSRKLEALRAQRQQLIKRRNDLWTRLSLDENYMHNCRLLVPGRIYPGVELSIGRAFLTIDSIYDKVVCRLVDNEIIIEHLQHSHLGAPQ